MHLIRLGWREIWTCVAGGMQLVRRGSIFPMGRGDVFEMTMAGHVPCTKVGSQVRQTHHKNVCYNHWLQHTYLGKQNISTSFVMFSNQSSGNIESNMNYNWPQICNMWIRLQWHTYVCTHIKQLVYYDDAMWCHNCSEGFEELHTYIRKHAAYWYTPYIGYYWYIHMYVHANEGTVNTYVH